MTEAVLQAEQRRGRAGATDFLTLHGANPEALYAALGLPMPDDVIDFSTNATVLPWPAAPSLDLQALASRYPDPDCGALRHLVAERERVEPIDVLFTNGSNEALYLLASLFQGRQAAILQPAYPEYRRALTAFGVGVMDAGSLSDLGAGLDLVILSNPSNPTGAYIRPRELLNAAARHEGTLFAVDEAYIDFLLNEELWEERQALRGKWPDNVLILRSLTKFYHLSGLRVGYVIGAEKWVRRMKDRQPTWSVNAVAQALALAFLRDGDFPRRSREFYRAETPRFRHAIEAAGFHVCPSEVHFFLFDVDDERVLRGLLARGIVARHTRNFAGLDGRCLRVATRLPAENDRFAAALQQLRSEGVF